MGSDDDKDGGCESTTWAVGDARCVADGDRHSTGAARQHPKTEGAPRAATAAPPRWCGRRAHCTVASGAVCGERRLGGEKTPPLLAASAAAFVAVRRRTFSPLRRQSPALVIFLRASLFSLASPPGAASYRPPLLLFARRVAAAAAQLRPLMRRECTAPVSCSATFYLYRFLSFLLVTLL